jgi:hypothetical protein
MFSAASFHPLQPIEGRGDDQHHQRELEVHVDDLHAQLAGQAEVRVDVDRGYGGGPPNPARPSERERQRQRPRQFEATPEKVNRASPRIRGS